MPKTQIAAEKEYKHRRYEVDAQRINSGDIWKSNSIMAITEGKIKPPFEFEGKRYVRTGAVSGGAENGWLEVEAYQVVPKYEFSGEIFSYSKKADLPFDERVAEPGFYHGIQVKYKKEYFVLVGPKVIFVPKKAEEVKKSIEGQNPSFALKKELPQSEHPTQPEVEIASIIFSQTEPQKFRRQFFTDENLADITESIKLKGVLEPILVRPVGGIYELCAGERRVIGATRAGLNVIPAVIKNFTDDEVDDIQLHENLHRSEPHPLEEAFNYHYLETKRGFDAHEIAARAAKSVEYVAGRKELLKLTEKIQESFRRNEIKLSHALEIAKYEPADQEMVYSLAFNNYGYTSQSLYPMPKFIEQIETHFLLRLDKATFSLKAANLHPHGLTCVDCHKRTGAKPLLWSDRIGKKDCCTDRKCFERKTEKNVEIQRARVAVKQHRIPEEKVQKNLKIVPLVSTEQYIPASQKPKEKLLTKNEYTELNRLEDCEFAEESVCGHGNRVGQTIYICRKDSKCPVHGKGISGKSPIEARAAEKEAKLKKEKQFDAEIFRAVRLRVAKKAVTQVDDTFPGTNSPAFRRIVARMWQLQSYVDSEVNERIVELLDLLDGFPVEQDGFAVHFEAISNLSGELVRKLWFLLIFETYQTQAEIMDLCDEKQIDYIILDAEERLAQAPMNRKDAFRFYLHELESGSRNAVMPKITDEYQPKI